jgi:lambda family phage minor tail protein L
MAIDSNVANVMDISDSTTALIQAEIQSLSPSALMELYVLDVSVLTGIANNYMYFYAGTNKLSANVIWQGKTYIALPIESEGFASGTTGALPRPKIRLANVDGAFSATVYQFDDLIGAKLIRKRTFVKYLDAVNFVGGINTTADPNQHYPDDVWFIDQKMSETRYMIEWELASAFDLMGVMLPSRQVHQNSCPWKYAGAECGYNPNAVGAKLFNAVDTQVYTLASDVCGKRLTSCEARFGTTAVLPYGGFPGSMQYG